jgi:hypothetical protein
MGRYLIWLMVLLPSAALGADPPLSVGLRYQAFAHGLPIMLMDVSLSINPRGYEINLSFHTTGLASLLYPGEQSDNVNGEWNGDHAAPVHFTASGVWRGQTRRTEIVYHDARPQVVALEPPITEEREPVPSDLQTGTEDTLSALVQLVRHVDSNSNCNTSARIYDGRRLSEIKARTTGAEVMEASGRSIFAGPTLRCDFTGQMLAGFSLNEDRSTARRPLHGSALFAPIAGTPALPVRIEFETRWFGDVTMFLTAATVTRAGMSQSVSTLR